MPKNHRHLNHGLLHLCSKFGDSSLNEWWIVVRTSPWLIHTHRDAGNDNTRRPKLASGKMGFGNFDRIAKQMMVLVVSYWGGGGGINRCPKTCIDSFCTHCMWLWGVEEISRARFYDIFPFKVINLGSHYLESAHYILEIILIYTILIEEKQRV